MMMMVMIDKNRLIKLLEMTNSIHDGESLNAIRLANSMLEKGREEKQMAKKMGNYN